MLKAAVTGSLGKKKKEQSQKCCLLLSLKKRKKERKKGTLLKMVCDNRKTFQVLSQENYNPVSTVLLRGYNLSRHLGIICSYDFSTPF